MKLIVKTPWVEVELPQLSGRILDIGGGGEGVIGRTASGEIYILDISEKELEEAKSRGAKGKFIKGDAKKMGFPDEYFDTVPSFFSLMHMRDLREAFRECYRVLRKGGKMHIWDAVIPRCLLYNINVIARSEKEVINARYAVVFPAPQTCEQVESLAKSIGSTLLEKKSMSTCFTLSLSNPQP
ncbi:class I SAM-dependent methyltransferase [Thermococcus sp. LS2]|uniref:class I SAM-dependent methyltransferase n=1 Tax=Thermococcus sp. LS2 TaxID=1638260 RepID=UPI00143C8BFA|nr:class I SAM-dependent methyltransferase [Thermococcus sp. LS2]NJE13666.1 class I SAM-dependent methyltransferase [Thermococcus sp. LS2]